MNAANTPEASRGPEALGEDPYYAAYRFRRALEDAPATIPAEPEAAAAMFEGIAEDDALGLVLDATPALVHANVLALASALVRTDSRPRVRAAWALALGEKAGDAGRRVLVDSLRSDPSPRVKAACLGALGRSQEELPFPLIRPFLEHPDARVRANAVEALVERHAEGVDPVLQVLVNDPAPRVAAMAALALWRRGGLALLEALHREEREDVRLAFLWAASRAGQDERLRAAVEGLLETGRTRERAMAGFSLAAVSRPDERPRILERALRHPETPVREAMIEGLHKAAPEATVGCLQTALGGAVRIQEGTERVVANALAAFRQLRLVPDLGVLRPHLESEDPRVLANALELVEERPDLPGIEPFLWRAFGSKVARVRANAAVALWRRGFPEPMATLRREVREADSRAAPSAAHGLGRMGGPVAEDALREALRTGAEPTRRIAFRFLSGTRPKAA